MAPGGFQSVLPSVPGGSVFSRGRLVPFAGKTWFMVVEKRV